MPRIVQQPQLVVWHMMKLSKVVLGEVKTKSESREDLKLDLIACLGVHLGISIKTRRAGWLVKMEIDPEKVQASFFESRQDIVWQPNVGLHVVFFAPDLENEEVVSGILRRA